MRNVNQTSISAELFLSKSVLNIRKELAGEYPSRSVILIIEITFRHGHSNANLQRVFQDTILLKSMSWGLLLNSSDLTKITNIFNYYYCYYYYYHYYCYY